MRNLKVLKENSLFLTTAILNKEPLGNLDPLIYTIVWSTTRLNVNAIKDFTDFVYYCVDKNIVKQAEVSPLVDLEMKKRFLSVIAGPHEIQDYLAKYIERKGLDKELMNKLYPNSGYN